MFILIIFIYNVTWSYPLLISSQFTSAPVNFHVVYRWKILGSSHSLGYFFRWTGKIPSKKKGQIFMINLLLVSTTNINQTDNKIYSCNLTCALKSSNYIVFWQTPIPNRREVINKVRLGKLMLWSKHVHSLVKNLLPTTF